tara:strand:+ start:576 stop:1892 length:1317 start_codon:yes stop_codon:yes gene_type:complete
MAAEENNQNNPNSTEIGIDLQEILSLAGIDSSKLEPGSELPSKIQFKKIKGIVVNAITNEPISGVKISNQFLKKDTTNKKGEFTIKHPDIEGTGLDPTNFPLNFKIKKYSPYNITPYTSVGEIKSNLGIIPLNPTTSNLAITELLSYPDSVTNDYATQDITFEFTIQKKLNTNIDNLKVKVIPLILSLVAAYGISEVQKLAKKNELNPQALLEDLKDVIVCPTKDEISKIIDKKNKLVKVINQTLNAINTTTDILATSGIAVGVASVALKILENLPLPTAIAGVGIPVNVINKIQDVIKFLSQLISKILIVNVVLLSILKLLQLTLTQVLQFLNLLDTLTQYCYPESTSSQQDQISLELTALTTQQSKQTSPVIVNVNGFKMGVETEITEKSLKRRRAIARNVGGIIMLTGEWSFSSIDQILIDELVFYIQQNNLKAD